MDDLSSTPSSEEDNESEHASESESAYENPTTMTDVESRGLTRTADEVTSDNLSGGKKVGRKGESPAAPSGSGARDETTTTSSGGGGAEQAEGIPSTWSTVPAVSGRKSRGARHGPYPAAAHGPSRCLTILKMKSFPSLRSRRPLFVMPFLFQ